MNDIEKIAALATQLQAATSIIVNINPPAAPEPLDWTAVDAAMTSLNTAVTDLQARFPA